MATMFEHNLYNQRRNVLAQYEATPQRFSLKNNSGAILDLIPAYSHVLDYGCDQGSMGFLGTKDGIIVDGYDPYVATAKYHDRNEIKGPYDVIVFSHVFEHRGMTQQVIEETLKWARRYADRIIIAQPNTSNLFCNFFNDYTHQTPTDNASFTHLVEEQGWKLELIVRNDLNLQSWRHAVRVVVNYLTCMDPFGNKIFVFRRA